MQLLADMLTVYATTSQYTYIHLVTTRKYKLLTDCILVTN